MNTEEYRRITSMIKDEGFRNMREITKKETEEKSKSDKDRAWDAHNILIKEIDKFLGFPLKKGISFQQYTHHRILALEYLKTFQNAFRLAEEGQYRSAFGELRDLLEIIMKLKLFYESPKDFQKWLSDPNVLYTTKDMRKCQFYKKSNMNEELQKFSKALSVRRHCSVVSLDAHGPIKTNACYYRGDVFKVWCDHLVKLVDLGKQIFNLSSMTSNEGH